MMNTDPEDIIKAVFERRTLWDPKDHQHWDDAAVKECWSDVARQLNTTEKNAKCHWEFLRCYYWHELTKHIPDTPGAGADEMGTSTWKYLRHMSFLKNILKPHSTSSNLTRDEEALVLDEKDVDINSGNEAQFSEANDDESVTSSPRPKSPANTVRNTSPEPSTSRGCNTERRTKRPGLHCIKRRIEEILSIEIKKLELIEKEQKDKEDEELLFFKSMLPYMKSLPSIKRLRVRSQMQNLLLQELFEQLENGTHTPGPTSPASD